MALRPGSYPSSIEQKKGKTLDGVSAEGWEPVFRIKGIIEEALFGGKENRAFLVKFTCFGREPLRDKGSVQPQWQEGGKRHDLET